MLTLTVSRRIVPRIVTSFENGYNSPSIQSNMSLDPLFQV